MNITRNTSVHEIAPGIFRLSTWVPEVTDGGFTFNQFLLTGEQPMLFHCGHGRLFPQVSEAISRVIPLDTLRWISFGHLEADECGAMNLFLGAAPHAEVIHGALANMLSLNDICDRRPVAAPDEPLDIGQHIGCGSSPRRTCHTTGKRDCGSTKRRRPCWRATCSPRPAVVQP